MLKEVLVASAPILGYPGPDHLFTLDTDVSNTGIGAALLQDGQEKVTAYFIKSLSYPEHNYCVTKKKKVSCIVKAEEHFHHHIYEQKFSYHFIMKTDISSTDQGALRVAQVSEIQKTQLHSGFEVFKNTVLLSSIGVGCSNKNTDAQSCHHCVGDYKSCFCAEVKFCPIACFGGVPSRCHTCLGRTI